MASTDTIVGIAGAVLLAGIMAAVFVYEYNNAPTGESLTEDEQARERFRLAYPLLEAAEDIDGDGTPNYLDGDMDNDGVVDHQQSGQLRVSKRETGSTQPPPATEHDKPFAIRLGTGNQGIEATLRWNGSLPDPLPLAPQLNLALFRDGKPHGEVTVQPVQRSGTSATITLTSPPLVPGNYTLRVSTPSGTVPQTAPETGYTLDYSIAYGPAQARGVESDPR